MAGEYRKLFKMLVETEFYSYEKVGKSHFNKVLVKVSLKTVVNSVEWKMNRETGRFSQISHLLKTRKLM